MKNRIDEESTKLKLQELLVNYKENQYKLIKKNIGTINLNIKTYCLRLKIVFYKKITHMMTLGDNFYLFLLVAKLHATNVFDL